MIEVGFVQHSQREFEYIDHAVNYALTTLHFSYLESDNTDQDAVVFYPENLKVLRPLWEQREKNNQFTVIYVETLEAVAPGKISPELTERYMAAKNRLAEIEEKTDGSY